jgi:hypothetical protein
MSNTLREECGKTIATLSPVLHEEIVDTDEHDASTYGGQTGKNITLAPPVR